MADFKFTPVPVDVLERLARQRAERSIRENRIVGPNTIAAHLDHETTGYVAAIIAAKLSR